MNAIYVSGSVSIVVTVQVTEDGKVAKKRKAWACPGCLKPVNADTLTDYKMGGELGEVGKWYVRGRCPHCKKWVQFTKHGAMVLRGPGKPGYPATVAVKVVRGEYLE